MIVATVDNNLVSSNLVLQFCVLRKELCKSSIRIQAQKIDIHSEVMLVVAW